MVASPRLQMVASTSNAAALVEVRHAPSAASLVRDSLVQMVASPRLPILLSYEGRVEALHAPRELEARAVLRLFKALIYSSKWLPSNHLQ